jgi:hypothetical protein
MGTGKELPMHRLRQFRQPSWLLDGCLVYSRLQRWLMAPGHGKVSLPARVRSQAGDNPDNDTLLLGAGASPMVTLTPEETWRSTCWASRLAHDQRRAAKCGSGSRRCPR